MSSSYKISWFIAVYKKVSPALKIEPYVTWPLDWLGGLLPMNANKACQGIAKQDLAYSIYNELI